jgi:DNA polymerase III subunit beta
MATTFTIDQKKLLSVLSSMQPICTKRTTLDATASILFQVGHKELVLKSTDLEIALQATCLLPHHEMATEYSFLVSGKRIFDLVKELEDEITFSFEHNQLSLQANKIELSLNVKDPEGFPPFPERIENLMHLDASFLLKLLEKVAFLIPQNNANSALNGLFLEVSPAGLTMTTTDGHCLAQVESSTITLEQEKKWLLPRRAIFELKKILENSENSSVFLGICGNQLVFSGEAFNFFTKLLSDQFPAYRTILNKDDFIPAYVDRIHLVKTLRRSVCLLSGQFLATTFGFDKELLNVAMQNKEVGKLHEALPLHGFTGSQLDIRFYAPYVLNGLQSFAEEQITFYLKNGSKPIIFQAQQEDYTMTYLVMPVSPTH